MDISMPGLNGIEATRIIHAELPGVRVLGLSMLYEEGERAEAIRAAGAVGYVSKSAPSERLAGSPARLHVDRGSRLATGGKGSSLPAKHPGRCDRAQAHPARIDLLTNALRLFPLPKHATMW